VAFCLELGRGQRSRQGATDSESGKQNLTSCPGINVLQPSVAGSRRSITHRKNQPTGRTKSRESLLLAGPRFQMRIRQALGTSAKIHFGRRRRVAQPLVAADTTRAFARVVPLNS
jgi:hypothetical protein